MPFVDRVRIALLGSVLLVGCSNDPAAPDASDGPAWEPAMQGAVGFPTRLVDDHDLAIDMGNVEAKRAALVEYLWGPAGLPSALPAVVKGVASPLARLGNLRRVDELRIQMDGGESNLTQHFIAEKSNDRLVVLSLGHTCSFADADRADPTSDDGYGMWKTIDALLRDGYSVLGTYMPHMRPDQCNDIDHYAVLAKAVATGHPVKWFLEPIVVSLNYLSTSSVAGEFPKYRDVSMMGLSGGGWTTTMYAAIDPRVRTSIPVAGTVPLYLRSGQSLGDAEQNLPELYDIAGYPDLYVLGATGTDRRQVQVLNRHDACCFGEAADEYDTAAHGPWDKAMRTVEQQVDGRLRALGNSGGTFRLEIDEAPDHHTVSWNTLVGTVLAELNGGTRRVAADTSAASTSTVFVRDGETLWRWNDGAWTDTKLSMVGTAAVLPTARGTELFYRSPGNRLMHAVPSGSGWQEEALDATLISDPVAAKSPSGALSVVGIGPDYHPIVVSVAGSVAAPVSWQGPRVVGAPAVVQDDGALHVYARGLDRKLQVFESAAPSTGFSYATLGGAVSDFPAAIRTTDGVVRAYVHDGDTHLLREVSRTPNDWQWADVDVASAAGRVAMLRGTPAVALVGDVLRVHSRTQSGSLEMIAYDDGDWSATNVRLRMNSSPVAIGDQVYGTAMGRLLWKYEGSQVTNLGSPR